MREREFIIINIYTSYFFLELAKRVVQPLAIVINFLFASVLASASPSTTFVLV